jgi:hypothetical protein
MKPTWEGTMRRTVFTVIGVCVLIISTALPVAAQTDSSVHKNYKLALLKADVGVVAS